MGDEPKDPKVESLWQKFQQEERSSSGKGPCINDQQLAAYLDHKLSADEVETIESHLAACPPCLNALKELREALGGPVLAVPEEVMTKAKDIVREGRARAWPLIGFWPGLQNALKGWQASVPGVVIATLIMACGLGGYYSGQVIVAEASLGAVSANKLFSNDVNIFNEDDLVSSFVGIFAS